MVSLTKQEPVEKEPSHTTATRRPQPLQPRSHAWLQGPFRRKLNKHISTPYLFEATITLHNVRVTRGVDHVHARQGRKKEEKTFLPFWSLQTLNRRHQDTLSLHLESTSNTKIFEVVFCPWGENDDATTEEKVFSKF